MIPHSQLPRFLTASLITVALAGCVFVVDSDGSHWHDGHYSNANSIHGSGVSKTEPRTVAEFRRVEVNGSCAVTLTAGSAASVTATADDNLLPLLVTEVRDGALVIEMKPGSYAPQTAMRVVATVPALDAVLVRGSSDIEVSGLAGERFSAEISGSGNVRARGKVDAVAARLSGSGDMRLLDLEAREANVEISGSGDVEVCATEALVASIAGSGSVSYKGDAAKVTKSIAGSGSVRKR
jgi:hypothetical protein